jgi:hypothetical protein
VLEKRKKKFYAYSGTNGSLFRLWLRLLHVMLDVILIVCLIVFAVVMREDNHLVGNPKRKVCVESQDFIKFWGKFFVLFCMY